MLSNTAAEGQTGRLPELAADLVRRQVSVIIAFSPAGAFAAKTATATIPIIFSVNEDPVRLGLVASLNRPGGNATGVNFFTAEVGAKRLDLLRELVPGAARVAVLVNPSNATSTDCSRDRRGNPGAPGQYQPRDQCGLWEVHQSPDALFVAGGFFSSRRVQLVNLASERILRTHIDKSVSMSAAFSKAPSRRSCRSCSQSRLSWSSMRRPPGRLATKYRRRCSRAPTR